MFSSFVSSFVFIVANIALSVVFPVTSDPRNFICLSSTELISIGEPELSKLNGILHVVPPLIICLFSCINYTARYIKPQGAAKTPLIG